MGVEGRVLTLEEIREQKRKRAAEDNALKRPRPRSPTESVGEEVRAEAMRAALMGKLTSRAAATAKAEAASALILPGPVAVGAATTGALTPGGDGTSSPQPMEEETDNPASSVASCGLQTPTTLPEEQEDGNDGSKVTNAASVREIEGAALELAKEGVSVLAPEVDVAPTASPGPTNDVAATANTTADTTADTTAITTADATSRPSSGLSNIAMRNLVGASMDSPMPIHSPALLHSPEHVAPPPEAEVEEPPVIEMYYPALHGCRSVNVYEKLNRVEEGAYGVVYRVRDKNTKEM